MKSDTTQRAKALCEFNDAEYKFGATATPVQRDPRDIYGIFKFIQPDLFPKKGAFGALYVKWSGYGRAIGSRNEKKLNEKISPYMIIKTKEEISDQLPKLIVTQRHCSLDPKQQELNDQLMEELDELHKKEEALMNGLTDKERKTDPDLMKVEAGIMMRQTALQELADSEELLKRSDSDAMKKYVTGAKKSSKLELLVELVSEIIDSGEKVAIFSRYAQMQDIIKERFSKDKELKKIDIEQIYGAMNDKDRYAAVQKFSNDSNCKIILLSDAAAEGLNLSKCGYMIEYDLANSYAIQTQRHGRIERADSTHDTAYVYQLICDGSFDEIAQKIVDKKERYDATIIKGEQTDFG